MEYWRPENEHSPVFLKINFRPEAGFNRDSPYFMNDFDLRLISRVGQKA